MTTGYKFAILNSDGTPSDTIVDMDDMFVSADTFIEKGLYAWGFGQSGRLGDGTIISKSSPVQIGTLTNWKQVDLGGSHSAAIKIDGTLWAWGFNTSGQLGDGTVVSKSSSVQIGSLTNWKQVSLGDGHSAAIKIDGTLWVWGFNTSGQLGDGTVVSKSSPIQVGSLTNWKQVGAGTSTTAAIKTDGTLWVWGAGGDGRLGDGTVVSKSSPVQIGSLTNWKQVACSQFNGAAIKTDGTLWTWGRSFNGALGDGTFVPKSSPVQIGLLSDWKQVSTGLNYMSAIKTDGTLWSWGSNGIGQLGDGTIISKSSPVQIGSLTNWKQVSIGKGGDTSSAIKTNGTLWTWGDNGSGQLGDGNLVHKSSPVQIGSLTNWKQVSSGDSHTTGILQFDGLRSIARTVEYVTLVSNNSTATTYTFNNVSIGTEAYSRYVVVGVFGHNENTVALDVSSCSIDGVGATLITNSNVGDKWPSALYGMAIPAGSTANVSVGFSGSARGAAVSVWSLYNLNSLTATPGTPSTNKILSFSYSAGDIIIVASQVDSTATTVTFDSPLVKSLDSSIETFFRPQGGQAVTRTNFGPGDFNAPNAYNTIGASFR